MELRLDYKGSLSSVVCPGSIFKDLNDIPLELTSIAFTQNLMGEMIFRRKLRLILTLTLKTTSDLRSLFGCYQSAL